MHYITVAEYESPGTVTCKIQGLRAETSRELVNHLATKNIIYSSEHEHKAFFEMDTQGVDVLNLLCNSFYKVICQSTVIEVSNIGGRTDKVQKTMWTLGKK
ncbi:uncharacterized protein LOC114366808 isoform X2 [Ostrinia furnacalis]|uniref:uncharacterized protein LOC114366808 isoform X2 n=1 Tax=Ostrinia furnacalis TaxID=93504 RepID=UPI001039080B|nr:uncharacterized protein LOC114366808 isoform X2 [Ostrinia furnacalis]